MRARVGVRSDVGRVREGNEDSYLARPPLFVIADGMGGHVGGEVASQTAVGVIQEHTDGDVTAEALESILRDANSAIWSKADQDRSLRGMGTTCTLLLLEDAEAYIAHVGDSRAYLLRRDRLTRLTEDHTLVERMVKEGRIPPEEAERHPQRSIITRVLGVEPEVKVDVSNHRLEAGDRVLLCSDGLTSMIDERAIASILDEHDDPQTTADRLVEAANDAGGEDNITVLVLFFSEGSPAPPPPPDRGTAASAVSQAPERATDEIEPVRAGSEPRLRAAGRQRSWAGRTALTLVVVGAVGTGAFFGAKYLLDNSFYVGVNGKGLVTIYRGVPEEIGSFSYRRPERTTRLAWREIPTDNLRANVRNGIKATSLEDAEQTVANLQDRVRDFERSRQGSDRTGDGKTGGGAGNKDRDGGGGG